MPRKVRETERPESNEPAAIWVPIKELTPWVDNPRINDDSAKKVAESIKRFGFSSPVIARKDNGEIIAGHTRIKAAGLLGLSEVPVRYMDLPEEEAHLLALADNRLGEEADWDRPLLKSVLDEFDMEDLQVTGFSQDEMDRLASDLKDELEQEIKEDEVPDVAHESDTVPGELILLGDHRLLCGDSTVMEDLEKLMDGDKADMLFTDPPYGVDYVGKTKDALVIENDGADGLQDMLRDSFTKIIRLAEKGSPWYVCSPAGPQFADFAAVLGPLGVWRQTLVWVKQHFVFGRSDYHYRHEAIFYGWKPGATHRPPPDRKHDTVWEFDRPARNAEHPTMKPVALVAHALRLSTSVGKVVLDPFCGSGTTLIAAEQTGRVCYGMELSPNYCDVIVKRWESLTDKKAIRHKP